MLFIHVIDRGSTTSDMYIDPTRIGAFMQEGDKYRIFFSSGNSVALVNHTDFQKLARAINLQIG